MGEKEDTKKRGRGERNKRRTVPRKRKGRREGEGEGEGVEENGEEGEEAGEGSTNVIPAEVSTLRSFIFGARVHLERFLKLNHQSPSREGP